MFFRSRKSKARIFSILDCLFIKRKRKVTFVVKNRTYFSGNLRVTLESFVKQASHDIYLYKDGAMPTVIREELTSLGVRVFEGLGIRSAYHLLTSGLVIFSHNPRDAHITRRCNRRTIVNVWHGVAIKNIELTMPSIKKERKHQMKNNSLLYDIVLASSEQDQKTNAKAFGLPLDKVKVTGLPRYEILKSSYTLSRTLENENDKILKIKSNQRMVLFAPTFRENSPSVFENISEYEWRQINDFSKENRMIFGIRPHPYDEEAVKITVNNYEKISVFSNAEFTEPNILLRHSDILIVDFTSLWVDYLLLKKPIVGFAKDYSYYLEHERGFIYDFNEVFPGNFTNSTPALLQELKLELSTMNPKIYKKQLSLFHSRSLSFDYMSEVYNTVTNKVNNTGCPVQINTNKARSLQ